MRGAWLEASEETERNMTENLGLPFACTRMAVLASLAALWCSPPAGADTIDQLYAMAKKEKTLVVWAADPTAGYDDAIRAFEQAIPRHRMVIGCSFGPR